MVSETFMTAWNYSILKYIKTDFKQQWYFTILLFLLYFDQINTALVSIE